MERNIRTVLFYAAIVLAGHFLASIMFNIPRQAEMLALVGIVLFYPILRNPLIGIYTFFIVSPLSTHFRRLYYLVHDRPGTDPLIIVGEVIMGFTFIGLFFTLRDYKVHEQARYYVRLVAGYFLYMVLRVFLFSHSPVSFTLPRFKFYGPAVLLFFLGILCAERVRDLKRLWIITIVLSSTASLYALKQLYLGYSQAEQIWYQSIDFTTLMIKDIVRPFSFFQAPVVFADYLQVGIIGIVILWLWDKTLPRVVLLLLGGLLFYGILITSVRSSWIGAFATLIFLFTFANVRGNRRRIGVIVGLLLAYIAYELITGTLGIQAGLDSAVTNISTGLARQQYLDLLIADRTGAVVNPFEEHSMVSRIYTWKMILVTSKDVLIGLVGRGMGQFKADSLYFTYLAEFGYTGLVFLLVVIFGFLWNGLKVIDRCPEPEIQALAKGITVLNLVLILVSITGTHIHTFPGDAYFWFWNGVIVNFPAIQKGLQNT